MAGDYPDWQPTTALIAAITALTTAVNGLSAGYGASAHTTPRLVANVPDGTNRTLVPGVAAKTATLMTALCSWQSVSDVPLRGYIDVGISFDNGATFYIVVLTPYAPTIPFQLGSGQESTAVNQAILWTATAADSAPINDSSISIAVQYVQR